MTDADNALVLVGLGEVLWDLLPEGKQLGGAPANFAYHACALGGCGVIASCVGTDELGREILGRLNSLGVGRRAVAVDHRHPTGTVTVELDARGNPRYQIHEDVAWDFIPPSPELLALAHRADAVCFGSLAQRSLASRETIRRFLAATRPDCLRLCDINLRQSYYDRDIITASLDTADVLKLNEEELLTVAELLELDGDEEQVLTALRGRFHLRLVVLTRGAGGSLLRAADRISVCQAAPVEVADTVGAGDSFTAVVAMGLLAGHDPDTIHRHAARIAGYVCTQSGGTPKIPADLKQFRQA